MFMTQCHIFRKLYIFLQIYGIITSTMAKVFDRQLTSIKQRFTEMQTVQSGLIT